MVRYSIALLTKAVCPILGVDAEKALRGTAWSTGDGPPPNLIVSGEDYFAICRSISNLAGEGKDLVALGRSMAIGPLDPVFLAFSIAPNAQEGLHRMARYKSLLGPMTLKVSPRRGGLRVRIFAQDPALEIPSDLAISIAVMIVEKCRNHSLRHIVPDAATLPSGAHNRSGLAEYFGARSTDGGDMILDFRAADMAIPFISENHLLWTEIRNDLERQLERIADLGTFADKVEAEIRLALNSGPVRVDHLCLELGISRSTLQRKLGEEGVRYQTILDRVRHELAVRYLTKSALAPSEIAFLVGFSDPNSFHRAFRKWTGKSPVAFREQSEGPADSGRSRDAPR